MQLIDSTGVIISGFLVCKLQKIDKIDWLYKIAYCKGLNPLVPLVTFCKLSTLRSTD
jgi:hypothetical protein